MSRLRVLSLLLIALVISTFAILWVRTPGYMDADYYFVTGKIIAQGGGFHEPFLWNYLDDPKGLPHPSFHYWMPLTSLLAALGQSIFGVGFRQAQVAFLFLSISLPLITAGISLHLHGDERKAWESGLYACLPGFFLPFFVTTDSFILYATLGAIVLFLLAKSFETSSLYLWFGVGLLTGLLHLTRADGVLFLALAMASAWFAKKQRGKRYSGLIAGYFLVVAPFWIRNVDAFGGLFAPGSFRVLWTRSYDELFSYPAEILTFEHWLKSGLGSILLERLKAFGMNLLSLVMVNGLIFLIPLMILGSWQLREKPLVRLAWAYLGMVMILMTLAFPFAGARGGYFHSSVAVMPLLWAVTPIGFRRAIALGVRYRNWESGQASKVFRIAFYGLAAAFTLGIFWSRVIGDKPAVPKWISADQTYQKIERRFFMQVDPMDRVAVNNPPGFYKAAGLQAVVIPDGDPSLLKEVLHRYQVDWLVLDRNHPAGLKNLYDNPESLDWLLLIGSVLDGTEEVVYIFKVEIDTGEL